MKKAIKRIVAVAASAIILISSSVSSEAADRSYTYNYDYWGDVQDSPDLYTVCKVFTSTDLGLETPISRPKGMFATGDIVYIVDSGNNRLIELQRDGSEKFKVLRIIDSFKSANGVESFNNPTDMAIAESGNIYIADQGSCRVLKLDSEYNYISQYNKPVDNSLDKDLVFQPNKIVVDSAERLYCIATGVNKGLIKYETDGSFSGFVGATPATYNFIDYLWKKIATKEQLAKLEAFVPTEYDNIYMDSEGFIYACTGSVEEENLKDGSADAIRKLNLLGNDILVRNGVYYDGAFPVYGDLYMGSGGGIFGPSYFRDVTVFDNDVYVCLDKNRGRLFAYDDQGKLLFCCGGNGNMDGYFRDPVAVDHMDKDILVLDTMDCALTLYIPTDFGNLVLTAMDTFDAGEYEASQAAWEKVIETNGNYDLAYIGLGRAHLRQKDYKTAMEYFELKYDDENWSKAFKQYRKVWVEDNIVVIVIVILALFLVPLTIGRIKAIKHEIDVADIFKD